MELNIVNEVATLERLTIGQLRQRFAELFGEATAASNRTWLIKRIVWRLQALAEGDLSERAADAPPNWPETPTYASMPHAAKSPPRPRRSRSTSRRRSITACRRRAPS